MPFTLDFEQFSVGAATYSWDFNDGNFSNTYSPTHTFLDTGTFEVSLSVSNACDYDTAFKTILGMEKNIGLIPKELNIKLPCSFGDMAGPGPPIMNFLK